MITNDKCVLTNDNREIINLELALITQKIDIMRKWIGSISDIIQIKDFIKDNICTTECYKHLLNIVVNSQSKILVKKDGKALAILRNIVRNNPTLVYDKDTSRLSFQVFQKYIFHNNIDMNNYANRLLINVILDDASIKWLIDNADASEHIVNRLLRYPVYNKRIAKWAKNQYQNNALSERKSELIGLMINDGFPKFIDSDDRIKIWGIYYSKTSNDIKKRLLLSIYSFDVIDDFILICKRLGYFDIIEEILKSKTNKTRMGVNEHR